MSKSKSLSLSMPSSLLFLCSSVFECQSPGQRPPGSTKLESSWIQDLDVLTTSLGGHHYPHHQHQSHHYNQCIGFSHSTFLSKQTSPVLLLYTLISTLYPFPKTWQCPILLLIEPCTGGQWATSPIPHFRVQCLNNPLTIARGRRWWELQRNNHKEK